METVKANIIQAMLSTTYKIALQIAEASDFLSKKEFPERWKVLALSLARFLKGDSNMYEKELVVLKTLLKIFKKFDNN